MSFDALRRDLAAIVGEEHVATRPSSLAAAGIPGTVAGTAAVVRPASAAEVSELVSRTAAAGAVIVPVGSGSRAQPPRSGTRVRVFVDLRRMCHVLNLDETSLVVHVQAGLTAMALEEVLAPRGLSLGDFPPSSLGSSIGGLLAVRTPGKASRRHGFFEDAVLGVSAVLADGRTVHTRVAPRRASGPDLVRALCGSEGTIGVITAAVLRVHRQPETRFLAAFALPSFGDALAAVRLALREEAAPAAMRVYDGLEARAHFGDDCCEPTQAVLVVATAGPSDLAACDRELVGSAAAAVGGVPLDESLARTWWARRTGAIGLAHQWAPDKVRLRRPINLEMPLPHLQVSATPGRQHEVYRVVSAAAREAGCDVRAHASRFDLDGGVLFFTLLEDGEAASPERAERLRDVLENAAAGAGAVVLGSWNPTLEPYFDRLRQLLDPDRVLNPDVG